MSRRWLKKGEILFYKNVRSLLNKFSHRHRPLDFITLGITGDCNLNCIFCYVGGKREGEIDYNFFSQLVQDARHMGVTKTLLSGGEPTLHPRFKDIVEHLWNEGIRTRLVTNATLIDANMARYLASRRVTTCVSLESINPTIDDLMTATRGGFEKKMNSIENLVSAGYTHSVPLGIIINLTKFNYETFIDTCKWAMNKKINPIYLDRLVPVKPYMRDWQVSGEQLRTAIYEMNKLTKFERRPRIPQVHDTPCSAHSSSIYINYDGQVYPCSGLRVSIGNVKNTPLSELWPNSEGIKKFHSLVDNLQGTCGSCEENKKVRCCGCRAIAYAYYGRMDAPDPGCWKSQEKEIK